ncbi:MAG TPA: response regulator [Blastocatellia bacterium]|nr:response regulator [Blastocatellia bacterium]
MPAKVLIIDDNHDILEMWAVFFNLEGFDVVTANDGREGYQKAESENPDIIVTDINMPILNGIRMVQKLRAHPTLNAIPIIAVTAYTSRQVESVKKAGANVVLRKPIETDFLINSVRRLLGSTGKLD